MNVYILDASYKTVGIIDSFLHLIWSERYNECGNFELEVYANTRDLDKIQIGYYISIDTSKTYMIVETIETTAEPESGVVVLISGRSLESILDRRIVWGTTSWDGLFQGFVKSLLDRNLISPTDEKRKIPNFSFRESTNEFLKNASIKAQLQGDGIYEYIQKECQSRDIGFRVFPEGKGGFYFELYYGVDRSYEQTDRPAVVFSPEYENLLNARHFVSMEKVKNAALVEGNDWLVPVLYAGAGTGLDRREVYVESSADFTTEDGENLPYDQVFDLLELEGYDKLSETRDNEVVDGSVAENYQFQFGKDFQLGDIVQVVTNLGKSFVSRVTEVALTIDREGSQLIPTFTNVRRTYRVLEFVQSTGEEYCDIRLNLNSETVLEFGFELDAMFLSLGNNSKGPLYGEGNTYAGFYVTKPPTATIAFSGIIVFSQGIEYDNNRHIWFVDAHSKIAKVDSDEKTFEPNNTTPPSRFSLFSWNGVSKVNRNSSRFYSLKFFMRSEITHYFIPVLRYDGVVGVYDKRNGSFYRNLGEGALIPGPETGEIIYI